MKELLVKDDKGYPIFIIHDIERTPYCIAFKVDDILTWNTTDAGVMSVNDRQPYLKGSIKWDGCSHLWFGDLADSKDVNPRDSYLHLCGIDDWMNHCILMKTIYTELTTHLKMDDEQSGDLWK